MSIKKWTIVTTLLTLSSYSFSAIVIPPVNEDFSTQPDPQNLIDIGSIPTNTWFMPEKRCKQNGPFNEDSVKTYAPGDGTSVTAPNPFPDDALQVGSDEDTIGLNYISSETWQAGEDYTLSFDWVAQPGIANPAASDYMNFQVFFSGYNGTDIYTDFNCITSWEYEESLIDTRNAIPVPTYGQINHAEITIPASALTGVIGQNTSITFKRLGKLATIFIDNVNIKRSQQVAAPKAIPATNNWAILLLLSGLLAMIIPFTKRFKRA